MGLLRRCHHNIPSLRLAVTTTSADSRFKCLLQNVLTNMFCRRIWLFLRTSVLHRPPRRPYVLQVILLALRRGPGVPVENGNTY